MTGPAADAAPPRGRAAVDALAPDRLTVATAASVAAAVLAGTSTGPIVVVAVLIGVGTLDRRSAVTVALVALAVSIRFNTATLDDLAGIQSVLGPAGTVGPTLAAASAWCAAGAVVLATRAPAIVGHSRGEVRERLAQRVAPAVATGLLAAAIVAGPGPDELLVRVGTSVAGVVVAVAVSALDRPVLARGRAWLGVVAAVAAVVLAGWPA